MKTQIITFGLLLAVLSFTSCKNNETVPQETPVTETVPTRVDTTQTTTSTNDTAKAKEKEENESDEKNE